MRRVTLIFMLGLSMLACSVSDITSLIPGTPAPPPPTAIPMETVYVTSTSIPSMTPTQPTPTFTTTPTLFYSGPSATPSLTPLPTGTLWSVGGGANLLTPQSVGFAGIVISGPLLYWGSCQPNFIKVIARVTDIVKTHDVTLWLRLKDKKSSDTTNWGGGAIMDNDKQGNFSYTLTAQNITGYHNYKSAWVQYQFVARDKYHNEVGRTAPYLDQLSIAPCP